MRLIRLMRLTRLIALAGLALLPALPASAGNPCPIDLTFYDLASPAGVDHAKVLDALESRRAWVGISFSNGRPGVKITAVSVGGPAAGGGVEVGDLVTSFNGTAVDTPQAMDRLLDAVPPGGEVTLDVERGGKTRRLTFDLGRHDPVFGRLVSHAAKDTCHKVRRGDISDADKAALVAALVTEKGALRCRDAHRAASRSSEAVAPGDLLFVRGARKVLLTMPGGRTACVKARDLDGAKLTGKAVGRLFKKVAGPYIKDRHDNP